MIYFPVLLLSLLLFSSKTHTRSHTHARTKQAHMCTLPLCRGRTHTLTPSPMGTYFSFLRRLISRSQTVDTQAHLLCLNLSTVRNDWLSFCLWSSISVRLWDGKIPRNFVGSLSSMFTSVWLFLIMCIWTERQSLSSHLSPLLYTYLWSAALDWLLSCSSGGARCFVTFDLS